MRKYYHVLHSPEVPNESILYSTECTEGLVKLELYYTDRGYNLSQKEVINGGKIPIKEYRDWTKRCVNELRCVRNRLSANQWEVVFKLLSTSGQLPESQ